MRTTLDIEDHLLIEAKQIAARTGRTLTSVVEDALRVSLQRAKSVEIKPIDFPTYGSGGTFPGVDISNSADLLDIMEDQK